MQPKEEFKILKRSIKELRQNFMQKSYSMAAYNLGKLEGLIDNLEKICANDICPFCGATTKSYTHKLNKGLVSALKTLYDQPNCTANISKIGLTHNQVANFQKLKYWGFIKPFKKSGYWEVTYNGGEFLSGRISVPDRVTTYRGEYAQIQKPAKNVTINDFFPAEYQKRKDYL